MASPTSGPRRVFTVPSDWSASGNSPQCLVLQSRCQKVVPAERSGSRQTFLQRARPGRSGARDKRRREAGERRVKRSGIQRRHTGEGCDQSHSAARRRLNLQVKDDLRAAGRDAVRETRSRENVKVWMWSEVSRRKV